MKKYTPESPYEGLGVKEELELIRAQQAAKDFFKTPSSQIEVLQVLNEGSYTSFMKALALTLANIIMIAVIIYALKIYFAVRDLNEIINQF